MLLTPDPSAFPSGASAKFPGSSLCAADVARGTTRMLLRHDLVALSEVPLDGNRRADLMAIDARGQIVIVEIKVSRADLLGDGKWTDYLGCCDRYYWAVPAGFDASPLDGAAFLPERTGIIVADRYDAAVVRDAHTEPLSAATRKRATLAFGRRAGRRLIALTDPEAQVML
ncbi:MmcB family DNA repair protein [Sphingomonas sp. 10B4]|uniref:MmcB family DNA repair protein n=1 Tax=Sphingomonas sp. 10B4 TaxID=3048575 RepID=UPI002AB3AAC5|nr:MmcB family DNA repair protein [Sphingomonas sp. 10B4]MDY7524075.1 MmcB family DNA repair protein [Sphingomonas sp. 10B4]MEB0281693.1 MmcB family DNA repair protein [Sphingomonas sp. 10B4]